MAFEIPSFRPTPAFANSAAPLGRAKRPTPREKLQGDVTNVFQFFSTRKYVEPDPNNRHQLRTVDDYLVVPDPAAPAGQPAQLMLRTDMLYHAHQMLYLVGDSLPSEQRGGMNRVLEFLIKQREAANPPLPTLMSLEDVMKRLMPTP